MHTCFRYICIILPSCLMSPSLMNFEELYPFWHLENKVSTVVNWLVTFSIGCWSAELLSFLMLLHTVSILLGCMKFDFKPIPVHKVGVHTCRSLCTWFPTNVAPWNDWRFTLSCCKLSSKHLKKGPSWCKNFSFKVFSNADISKDCCKQQIAMEWSMIYCGCMCTLPFG